MLTGALASSYYGRPRTTLDLDVVIDADEDELAVLARVLTRAALKVQLQKLKATWRSAYRIITIGDTKSPHYLDLIFTDRKLERKAAHILGLPTYCQTAQSLILAKLRMIKTTVRVERAATDREDIRAILKTTHVSLKGLRRKAKKESTAKILEALLKGEDVFSHLIGSNKNLDEMKRRLDEIRREDI